MIGALWHMGVAIDPGRLIDDTDEAYYLMVVASYQHLLGLKEAAAAEEDRVQRSMPR